MISVSPFIQLSPRKRAFLTGAVLLTGSGFVCRILGFFYRIFLSRRIDAEGLGIFQMIHPIYGICFSLCAGSIQTALSQLIAANVRRGKWIFQTGLVISFGMSVTLAALICRNAQFLADHILLNPDCAGYLPFMGISVPFAAFHACVNGYYYGMQKSRVPAFSQIAEQMSRMILVFLLVRLWQQQGKELSVMLAVIGHLAGEAAAAGFTVICMVFYPPAGGSQRQEPFTLFHLAAFVEPLLSLAFPLMGNRLILNLLSSAEAVWIPSRLELSGLTSSESLACYGILTGMALPFIFFPSAISNSMAVLLLPGVAQAQAEGKEAVITESISLSLRYSLYMGILCIGVFTMYGGTLGTSIFHASEAGYFIRTLAWLCPFLYLAATMGSILNGLGRTRTTFLQNTAALILRLCFVFFGIPVFGIRAYLIGMLISEILLAAMHLISLKYLVPFSWDAADMIGRPAFCLLTAVGITWFLMFYYEKLLTGSSFLNWFQNLPLFFITFVQICILCFFYGGLLILFHFSRQAGSGSSGNACQKRLDK
ncbi:MAG: oligosaccharide flippase family protein [Clostridiales bacterium]|nr:oligosaccharide flippase family protein [Clostridiales bacterium]